MGLVTSEPKGFLDISLIVPIRPQCLEYHNYVTCCDDHISMMYR
jgi:hypothetical protein